MFNFTDGTSMSNREAAELVRAEGKLIANQLVNIDGQRCVSGVILNVTSQFPLVLARRYLITTMGALMPMIDENNNFEGTLQERCEHMAAWLEGQPDV